MTFAHPIWIIAGFFISIGTLLLLFGLQSRRQAKLARFAAAHLLGKLTRNVSTKRQITKRILFCLALFSCFIALARPQYGFRWQDIKRKGIDILFALDTSKSMLAKDVKPDRLGRAKYAIMDFVSKLDGDRVGLLPFAGTAYLMCPLTGDYTAFDNSLKAVNTSSVPVGGTNIGAAIKKAETVLTNEANYKLLILITDGENLQGNVLTAAKEAAKKGLRIYTVGVGTREGELIPISSGGTTHFLKDSSGNFIVSHLDEETLTQIAKIGNGVYVPLGNRGQGLETIYQQKLSLMPKQELTQRREKMPIERFQWPLAAALILLSLDFLIGSRKSKPLGLPFKKFLRQRKNKKVLSGLLLILWAPLFMHPVTARASKGETYYRAGNYQEARQAYKALLKKHPDDPKLQYDFGTASYKSKKYDDAIQAFSNALKTKDLSLQERAYYNRGNALYRKGEKALQRDSQETLANWQQAVESYNASLALNKNNKDAIFNRDLVRKKINELKKKEKNQRQSKPKNQNQKDRKKKKNDKGQQKQQQNAAQGASSRKQQPTNPKAKPENQGKPKPSATATSGSKKNEPQHQSGTSAEKTAKPAAGRAGQLSSPRKQGQKGKMTREDAVQLLDSLKNEEGRLNYVPQGTKGSDEQPRRDW